MRHSSQGRHTSWWTSHHLHTVTCSDPWRWDHRDSWCFSRFQGISSSSLPYPGTFLSSSRTFRSISQGDVAQALPSQPSRLSSRDHSASEATGFWPTLQERHDQDVAVSVHLQAHRPHHHWLKGLWSPWLLRVWLSSSLHCLLISWEPTKHAP